MFTVERCLSIERILECMHNGLDGKARETETEMSKFIEYRHHTWIWVIFSQNDYYYYYCELSKYVPAYCSCCMLLFCRRYELRARRNGYTECCDRYWRNDESSYGLTSDYTDRTRWFCSTSRCIEAHYHRIYLRCDYSVIERFRINIDT